MSKHNETLGEKWYTLLADPQKEIPQMIPFVLSEGGTRTAWQHSTSKLETMLIAWPKDAHVRAGVVVQGAVNGELNPRTISPLLEGLPNDLTVEEVVPWKSAVEGSISARRNEQGEPLWMYSPLLYRDEASLTPGVRHTFMLSGLAMGLRRGLIDETTITEGAQYEAYAKEWLEKNPTATRLDVPQLTVSLKGARILAPMAGRCDYQARVPVTSVTTTTFANETVYMLHIQFGLNTPEPLNIMLYASEKICKGYVPEAGDEVDIMFWLQGYIID